MCSLKHWKKTTSELDISRMFKLRTGARLCSGRGGTIFIRGHSGPSFNSISTHPVSVSDPRVLLWFNRGCNKHKTLRAKAIMWVGLDRSTYGTGTPLRPGSTFIDGFSKCGTPNFKSPPVLHLWPLWAKASVWVYLDESTTRYAIASRLHSYWRIFKIDTSKDSCWNQLSFGILPLKIHQ